MRSLRRRLLSVAPEASALPRGAVPSGETKIRGISRAASSSHSRCVSSSRLAAMNALSICFCRNDDGGSGDADHLHVGAFLDQPFPQFRNPRRFADDQNIRS